MNAETVVSQIEQERNELKQKLNFELHAPAGLNSLLNFANEQIAQLTKERDAQQIVLVEALKIGARYKHERDAAEAKCAEMREMLNHILVYPEDGFKARALLIRENIGQGWLSPEKKKVLVEAFRNLLSRSMYVCQHRFGVHDPVGTRLVAVGDLASECERARKTLESIK